MQKTEINAPAFVAAQINGRLQTGLSKMEVVALSLLKNWSPLDEELGQREAIRSALVTAQMFFELSDELSNQKETRAVYQKKIDDAHFKKNVMEGNA